MTKAATTGQDGSTLVEARLDLEFILHPTAPDRLLDGTVRHPAACSNLPCASRLRGAAARKGVEDKLARYPARGGKSVFPCAVETWGYVDERLDALLDELAAMAAQRQRDRGVLPTRWGHKWRTLLSIQMAVCIATSIFHAMPDAYKIGEFSRH